MLQSWVFSSIPVYGFFVEQKYFVCFKEFISVKKIICQ